MGRKKYTIEKARGIFKNSGCKLLSEVYDGFNSKLEYKCRCGSISIITLTNFQRGHRCRKCWSERIRESLKFSYNEVKKIFEDEGCELLSEEYMNANTLLGYRCVCGNISKVALGNFNRGRRCKKCSVEKNRKKSKHSYDYVYDYFLNEGCELIDSEYINGSSSLGYKCGCGDISKISFNAFYQGQRCKKCGIEKQSGRNHHNYNFDLTDEERLIKRGYPGYRKWRTEVYERDDYTCRRCHQIGGSLNAHHIKNYSDNKEIRLDIGNGITFCKECHDEFHLKYGKRKNGQTQLDEFLKVSILCLK